MPNQSRGIVWIAFGYEFLGMVLHSARTAMENNPGIGRAVITNLPLKRALYQGAEIFDHIEVVEADNREAFKWKLLVEQYVSWEHALFLDADIEVRRDLEPVFNVLNHYPIALCPRSNPCNKKGELWGGPLAGCGLREFNSGVFAFDRTDPRITDFFERLRINYAARNERIDQPSFMVTIYQDPSLPVAPLSLEWNATNRWEEAKAFIRKYPGKLGLYHYRCPHRFHDVEAAMKETLGEVILEYSRDSEQHSAAFDGWRKGFVRACRGTLRYSWDRFVAKRLAWGPENRHQRAASGSVEYPKAAKSS